ncbi:hypothetical protein W97_02325 [Coniosporium apollinis CBS 100218]|uniref:Glycosyl hydrolase family 32 N-terminal domain-containing protein n=1 Tax=Coniosporium apollinis (strain CBS 100218) TaxID=1168221 RepID=R7YMM7_CONA1|nr:uncharacterized protein W97_02325 [Coniosporium apollinis CBS 100218]EON63098.1 hypothetical protein W97_02325 [Coniosporium apollinis CBS 100218]
MSWGHAVSTDLTRWTQLPDPLGLRAVGYESGTVTEAFFSGGAISDPENTSGFATDEHGALVAIFTLFYPRDITHANGQCIRAGTQAQGIAYSNDDGLTWTQYSGNPVIPSPPTAYADQYADFRDPAVFWHAASRNWIMVLALSVLHKLLIYTSPDLKNWTQVSEFGPLNAVGGKWECPNLFPLPVDGDAGKLKWVMIISLDPGGPVVGSGTQYVVGDFDGRSFTADAESIHAGPTADSNFSSDSGLPAYIQTANWMDHGPDFYAPISWTGVPDYGRVAIAWMSNWDYARDIPTEPWRGAMSVPRVLELRTIGGKLRLVQRPVDGFEGLMRPEPLFAKAWASVSAGRVALDASGKALDVRLSFCAEGSTGVFGIALRAGRGQETVVGYEFETARMYVDRRNSGSAFVTKAFPGMYYAPLTAGDDDRVRIRVLLDWSSVEVFGGLGESTITAQIFPDDEGTGITMFSTGVAEQVEVEVRSVNLAW